MVSLVTQTRSLNTEPEESPTETPEKYWEHILSNCPLSSLISSLMALTVHRGQFNANQGALTFDYADLTILSCI